MCCLFALYHVNMYTHVYSISSPSLILLIIFAIVKFWPSQHLKLVLLALKPFLNHFCFLAGRIILLKEATVFREYHSMKGCTQSVTMLR